MAKRKGWTLNTGRLDAWTLDAWCWTLDEGVWMLDSGLSMLDVGLWALDTISDCFRTKSEASF